MFIALRFTEAERAVFAHARDIAQAELRAGRPSPDENLHLTLAFLGAIDASEECAARAAMEAAARSFGQLDATGLSIPWGDLGSFDRRKGGIVWRGIRGTSDVFALQSALACELRLRGFDLEERPFVPHVTLVRSARAQPGGRLTDACARASAEIPPLVTRHRTMSLMWSHHPAGGSLTYTPVFEIGLTPESWS